MDWKLLAMTFGTVFLAELGDKTQLATLAFTADSKKPWTIFLGSSLALVLAAGLGVAAGSVLSRWVNPAWVRRGSAVLFVAIGAWLLLAEFRKTASGNSP
jgi:putative Ca2+/H+ antiporter (TMEM165/GDT1 family)